MVVQINRQWDSPALRLVCVRFDQLSLEYSSVLLGKDLIGSNSQ